MIAPCYENIPEELKSLDRWVGAMNDSKVPFRCGNPEKPASSTNTETWSTWDIALTGHKSKYYDYCGFVFAGDGYVGIDIDTGFDEEGFVTPLAAEIIASCESYTELSRSGRGFHIILKGELPFKGRNNLKGLEIYKCSRYFIMTGVTLIYTEINGNQSSINEIVEKYFPEAVRENNGSSDRNVIYKPIWKDVAKDGKIRIRPFYPPIQQGGRNLCLTSLAGNMHQIGYGKKAIFQELQKVNSECCKPSLPKRELITICNSVTRYKR